jgi:hypothetical protein
MSYNDYNGQMGQPMGMGFEQPTGMRLEQPTGVGFEQPTGMGFGQSTDVGFGQPTGMGFRQQRECMKNGIRGTMKRGWTGEYCDVPKPPGSWFGGKGKSKKRGGQQYYCDPMTGMDNYGQQCQPEMGMGMGRQSYGMGMGMGRQSYGMGMGMGGRRHRSRKMHGGYKASSPMVGLGVSAAPYSGTTANAHMVGGRRRRSRKGGKARKSRKSRKH